MSDSIKTTPSDVTTLAKGAGINSIGEVTAVAMQFISHIALARLLGPHDYGLYAIGWTILRISRVLSGLGLEKGVIRFGSGYWPDDMKAATGVVRQSIALSLTSGVLFGVALYLLSETLAIKAFHQPELAQLIRYFALFLVLMSALRISAASTRITQRMQYSVVAERIVQPSLNALLIILMVGFWEWGITGAVLALGLSYGLALMVGAAQLFRLFPHLLSRASGTQLFLSQILVFSIPAMLASFTIRVNTWLDRLLVGHFLTMQDTGVYVAASQVTNLFTVVTVIFSLIFGAMAAKLYAKAQMERLGALYRISTKWALYLSLSLFLTMMFAPGAVITVAFGNGYSEGTVPLLILAVAHMLMVLPGPVGMLLIMTGNQNRWFALALTALATNVILNLLLIPRFGINGAAFATGLSMSLLFLLGLWQVRTRLGLWPFDRRYWKGSIAVGVTSLLAWAVSLIDFQLAVVELVVMGVVVITALYGTLWILGLDGEDREVLARIRGRVLPENLRSD